MIKNNILKPTKLQRVISEKARKLAELLKKQEYFNQ